MKKKCTGCGKLKGSSEFYARQRCWRCKVCKIEYVCKYYKKNKERLNEYQHKYYEQNKERIWAYKAEWYQKRKLKPNAG